MSENTVIECAVRGVIGRCVSSESRCGRECYTHFNWLGFDPSADRWRAWGGDEPGPGAAGRPYHRTGATQNLSVAIPTRCR